MDWFRTHPLSIAVTIAALLFFIGLAIVDSRSPTSITSQSQGWVNPDGTQGYQADISQTTATPSEATPAMGGTNGNYHFISPFSSDNTTDTADTAAPSAQSSDNNSLDDVLALISKPTTDTQKSG